MYDIFIRIEPIITLFGVLLACVELIIGVTNQKRGWHRQKMQATLDAYNQLQESVFDKINQYKPSEIKEISENTRSEEYKILSGYLARIEHFCVGINQSIYDFDTFYKLSHGYFDGEQGMLYTRLIPILESKGLGAKEDYFINIHVVWEKMNKYNDKKT